MTGEVVFHWERDNGSIPCLRKELQGAVASGHTPDNWNQLLLTGRTFNWLFWYLCWQFSLFLSLWKKKANTSVYVTSRRNTRFLATDLVYLDGIVLCFVGMDCHIICESFLITRVLLVIFQQRRGDIRGCLCSCLVRCSHPAPV